MNYLTGSSKPQLLQSIAIVSTLFLTLAGCATESHRTLEPQMVPASQSTYHGAKHTLVVGKFRNNSAYLRGIFSGRYRPAR